MSKTNLEIERECTLNWIQNYREAGDLVSKAKIPEMEAHLRYLNRKIG